MRNKTVIAVLSMVMIFVLAACGKTNEWVGTYGGTSTGGHKVEITINDDGTVQYKRDKDITAGTWTERNTVSYLTLMEKYHLHRSLLL